ncbi:hypothetical protein DFP72DRAFT_878381 [Ephemerocybe angulata]|uniref:Uncharacterized protein n=1 Tax=Ephemerocybe angulata TaxID=980116 RepID=A0A8H6IB22_9AGAR|nr:hypothetical protein DFP72DRAFT_878381 [Tulosesus angulatus]
MYPVPNKFAGPPSPPDTNSSYFGLIPTHSAPVRPMATPGSSFDAMANGHTAPMETPSSRFRRGSSIGYISTPGHREPRERTTSVASKFLVVVVPPSSVAQEHGNLGHTLSMGPGHRLSQGLIMPLFPTMYGQLTAISREFSFPSSSGICLYYCYTDHGVTMTPRLSDDIWQTVWGLTDPAIPGSGRPPIVGKLEFDIDLGQARWYSAWLAPRYREPSESYAPTTAPNLPYRGDNRFTFPPSASEDGFSEQPIQLRSAPIPAARHVPRKLSLIDRVDGTPSEDRTPGRLATSPPTGLPLSSHVLSPITQQEEPQSARLKLSDRVKSWRASAISNAPVDIPPATSPVEDVTTHLEAASPASQSSFHMEDYAFSYQQHWSRRQQFHWIESYCTSAGPSDTEFYYNFEVDSRPATPDMACRMWEEAPETPVTATSWGAPSVGPWSLSSEVYSPSLDLGYRAQFSPVPSPPSTATSWGPQSFDGVFSASSQQTTFSVHLGDRGVFTAPPTPQTATSWGAPSVLGSPMSPSRLLSPDVAHRQFDDADEWELRAAEAATWCPASPEGDADVFEHDTVPSDARPWGHNWPYRKAGVSLKTVAHTVSAIVNARPAQPWGHSWPYRDAVFELSAPPKGRKRTSASSACTQYPTFTLYSPVYPYFDLYPGRAGELNLPEAALQPKELSVSLSKTAGYPFLDLYAPVYPHFDLYPQVTSVMGGPVTPVARGGCKVKSNASASAAQPWGHSWPYRKAGPALRTIAKTLVAISSLRAHVSTITNAPSAYPHFNLYPAIKAPEEVSQQVTGFTGYPSFILYPSVYPYNLMELYPGTALENSQSNGKKVQSYAENPIAIFAGYPTLCIYHPVYSHNLGAIYPPIVATKPRKQMKPEARSVHLDHYPIMRIYALVYPHNLSDIYPALPHGDEDRSQRKPPVVQIASMSYPSIVLYPAQYPFFDLYPEPAASRIGQSPKALSSMSTSARPAAHYPFFDLYPPVYPYFSLWPMNPSLKVKRPMPTCLLTPRLELKPKKHHSRLTHSELHAMVMMEQQLAFAPLPEIPIARTGAPPSLSPVKRTGSVRFREVEDPPRRLPPLRTSTLPPRRSDSVPQRQLPAVPSTSLARSSTLPFRRPQPSTESTNSRSSLYSPETARSRGLRHNTMSTIIDSGKVSPISRRMTLWENKESASSPSISPSSPSIKQTARRDSIVFQRIKAFNTRMSRTQLNVKDVTH